MVVLLHRSRGPVREALDVSGANNDDLRRGPKWRTRAAPSSRRRMAVLWFAAVVAVGAAIMLAVIRLLEWLGAPGWLVLLPWWLPAVGVIVWTMLRPGPAILSDDDDDSWVVYVIRYVLVGEDEPRAAPVRGIAAAAFGAPVVCALAAFGVLTLLGLG